jgi:biopolymer transport protein ExbD
MMAAGLASSYADEEDDSLSGINVTPIVDVVLVLLIVFMITVPAIVGTARVNVNLPETTAVAAESQPLPLAFVLRRSEVGRPVLYLNDQPADEDAVRALFTANGQPPEEQPVSLSADRGIEYGEVIEVVDLLESLGVKKLALDTRHVETR